MKLSKDNHHLKKIDNTGVLDLLGQGEGKYQLRQRVHHLLKNCQYGVKKTQDVFVQYRNTDEAIGS